MPSQPALYRHDEIVLPRPYGVDVDGDGWLWEGTTGNRLLGHHLRTAELRVVVLPELDGQVVFSVFAWDGKLVLELGYGSYYLVYEPSSGRCVRKRLPGENPITWYGAKLPNGKLMLCDRGSRQAVILDAPEAEPRVVPCPYEGDFGMASVASDGLAYAFLGDPARVVRFDPARERFIDERPLPWQEVGLSGRFDHEGVLYGADSAGGRILPLDLRTQKWLDPIVHPDHGKVFGFIGGGFKFGNKGYFNLSTYAARSRLDTKTGKLIVPEGGNATIDGRWPPRFMEHYLVFDPAARSFDYLTAPEQPDGVPLLCYAWADEKHWAITGYVMPFEAPGVPGHEPGPWLVFQSEGAADEPPLGPFDFGFDREAHLRRYRRSYGAGRALYLPEAPHTPPIENFTGPALAYPPGKDAELRRRAAKTDKEAYWKEVARRLAPAGADDATKMRLILEHVQHHVYYNPVQVPQTFDPIAIHEAHDGRCGHGVTITLELARAMGVETRLVGLASHCVAEAFYDGSWHIADALFFGGAQPAREGRVLSVDELKAEPYFADAYPQRCFAYDPELLMSQDGYQVLGYVFGPWGSEPYYSYYLGAPKEHPPSLPVMLPAKREGERALRLSWSAAVKLGGGRIEYGLRVCEDRACQREVFATITNETSAVFRVPEANRMYFAEVRAMDDHRAKNRATWYAAARWNFVLVPETQYGWYGVL